MQLSGTLATAVGGAARFIEENRNADGLWSDFLTLAGESVYWVSGYVGYALASARSASPRALEEVGRKLLAHQHPLGGWGYGPMVPPDADSTAWCLLFLSKLGVQGERSLASAVDFLLKHQSPLDCGFRTYAVPREVARYMMLDGAVSFEGWSSSQLCVTPVAIKALAEAGAASTARGALGCVRSAQSPDGGWEPYWWSERLYSTCHCMEVLRALGAEEDETLVMKGAEWIAGTQRPDGSWSESPSQEGVPFSTALALSGLMVAPGGGYSEAIGRGAEWLLASQSADGGWAAHHILRIPHPAVKEPWRQTEWRRDGRAIGAVIKDHRRLFTTATALTALSELERRAGGGGR